jgi:hypothetical protein
MNLFAGDKGSISFNWTGTTEQMAAHIVEKVSRKVVGKFSFPAREGYQLLTKSGDNYTGKLTPEMTIKANTVGIDIEIKAFIDDENYASGRAEIAHEVIDNTLKSLEKL